MTPSSLTARINGYKIVEAEYETLEAEMTGAILSFQSEVALARKSREYIAGLRIKLESELAEMKKQTTE